MSTPTPYTFWGGPQDGATLMLFSSPDWLYIPDSGVRISTLEELQEPGPGKSLYILNEDDSGYIYSPEME